MGTHVAAADYLEARTEPAIPANREAHSSGVAWGAVIGGAFVICALYLILLALGAGFGLLAASPWSGISASSAGTASIIWMIVVEILACAFGGYLTGRLRTKWTLIHTDEVYFRDTANGFLAWAVALVLSVGFLATAAASMSGFAMQNPLGGEGVVTAASAPAAYFADTLFRSDRAGAEPSNPAVQAEAERILASGLEQGQLTQADQNYLARLVAARTGISQPDAERRVSDTIAQARQTVDDVRKATAHFLLWLFLSLLLGAFSASLAATIGGRQRDHVRTA